MHTKKIKRLQVAPMGGGGADRNNLKGKATNFFSTMRKMPGCIRTNPTKQKNITLFTSKSI